MYTCLGRRPIPKCAEISKSTLREVLKVALGPSATEADAHTPSRRCAPCSLACFHFFFRELPLLTRPHLTQPLLLTFETAGKSAFSSPYDVSVAAARQDICTISRQLNNSVAIILRLVPGSIPALADRCSKKRLWSVPRPYLHLS